MKSFKLIISLLFLIRISFAQETLPAFPSAEGFGANTVGGRGGKVIKVTTLKDSGPGSLRAAINEDTPRIVVFDVAGIIDLESELHIKNPYLTIAGQSAPGGGICLRGEGIKIESHDVVIRYLRIRPGDVSDNPSINWGGLDAISVGGKSKPAYNVVIDHCSLSWSVDEVIDFWYDTHDITIQNSIISEALHRSKHPKGDHGMGMLIGSKATNISIHHNLLIHNNDRNPHINGRSKVDFRNNIIYDPGGMAIDLGGNSGQQVNLVNNYIIKGPYTNAKANVYLRDTAQVPKLYIEGNIGISQKQPLDDNWLLIRDLQNKVPSKKMQKDKPFPHPEVNTLSAKEAYNYMLKNVGAILPERDAMDRKLIHDLQTRKGSLVNSKHHLLEWPMLSSGIPVLDTDGDGIPDHWEEIYGLNNNEDDSSLDTDGDGYTNIEEFLNRTDPTSNTQQNNSSISTLGSDEVDLSATYSNLTFGIDTLFPNPINDDTTNMKFTIDKPSQVALKVFNQDGKEMLELVKGFLYEGHYHIVWDCTGLNPGMYIVSLASKDKKSSYKAIITK